MNKAAIVIVVAALGLGGYVLLRPSSETEAPKPVTVKGYLSDGAQAEWRDRKENPLRYLSEKEEDRKKKFSTPPFDEIVVTRGKTTIRLKKPNGTEEWELVEPTQSSVETFRIKSMLEAFATDTALNPSRTVKNKEHLADFGLDDGRAIHVRMLTGGTAAVDLVIGDRKKLDGGEAGGQERYDTFVMVPAHENEIYRAKLKDLRKPFENELSDLRSKEVFGFDLTEIQTVTVQNPNAVEHKTLKLAASWSDKPLKEGEAPKKDKDGKEKGPEKEGKWTLKTPAITGFNLTNLRSYWSSLAGLRASKYIMEAPGKDSGLTDPTTRPRITMTVADGADDKTRDVTLVMGDVKEKDKTYYAMVEGSGEHMIISKYTYDNLLKSLDDLRDKNVLGIENDDEVTRVEIVGSKTGVTPMVLTRGAAGWTIGTDSPTPAFEKAVKGIVSGLRYLRATEFLSVAPKPEESGLDKPTLTVKATIKGEEKTVVLGADRDSKVYAHLLGTDLYFRVGTFSRDKFDKSPTDFKDRKLISVQVSDVETIELSHTDERVLLARVPGQPDSWQMTSPEQLTGATGLDENTVKGVANNFSAFEVKSFTDKTIEAAGLTNPVFRATVTLKDGTTREVRVSDTMDGEAHYISLAGPGLDEAIVYTLDKYKVGNLRKKAADLKKGG